MISWKGVGNEANWATSKDLGRAWAFGADDPHGQELTRGSHCKVFFFHFFKKPFNDGTHLCVVPRKQKKKKRGTDGMVWPMGHGHGMCWKPMSWPW